MFWDFFTDPLLRAPFLGSIFISFATSLIGVMLFVQRRSLLAETLSHATYPGVIIGVMVSLFLQNTTWTPFFILLGGIGSALFAMAFLKWMTHRHFVVTDSALTFILTTFFSIGILLASYIQSEHPLYFRIVKNYFYGQSATLTDQDIWFYGSFTAIVVLFLLLFRKESTLLFFDSLLAQFTLPLSRAITFLFTLFITAAIVISMRSVGVILISGLLIAPALAARQFTHSLLSLLFLAGLFGAVSGLTGNLSSFYLSSHFHLSFPTGPMIVMSAQCFALLSLLFAPQRGLVLRMIRIWRFQWKCMQENLLKTLWYNKEKEKTFRMTQSSFGGHPFLLSILLLSCRKKGWIKGYSLTEKGEKVGGNIVRLHRLWELYLVEDLGMQKELVHKSAEEMEHILTQDLAAKLTAHLSNPRFDPHNQPIPGHYV